MPVRSSFRGHLLSIPTTILIYGRDHSLLETRGWVLERAGYRVFLAMELDEAIAVVGSQAVGLLLLCHSLCPEDSEEAIRGTAAICPGLKNLLVTANTVVASSAAGEPTVSAFAGPRAMLAAVKTAMGTKDGAA